MTIDFDKPVYVHRKGCQSSPVGFIVHSFENGDKLIVWRGMSDSNPELYGCFTPSGICREDDKVCLRHVPHREEYWVNVYRKVTEGSIQLGEVYCSYENAIKSKDCDCKYLTTVRVYEEECIDAD